MNYQGASNQVSGAYDFNGDFFPLESLAQTFIRDGSGNITQIIAKSGAISYTKTFTYASGKVTAVSAWVKG